MRADVGVVHPAWEAEQQRHAQGGLGLLAPPSPPISPCHSPKNLAREMSRGPGLLLTRSCDTGSPSGVGPASRAQPRHHAAPGASFTLRLDMNSFLCRLRGVHPAPPTDRCSGPGAASRSTTCSPSHLLSAPKHGAPSLRGLLAPTVSPLIPGGSPCSPCHAPSVTASPSDQDSEGRGGALSRGLNGNAGTDTGS